MKMYKKVSNAAKAKSNLVNTNFFKYFVRAVMAGFFIDMAMIYSNVVGNVFSKTTPDGENFWELWYSRLQYF